MSSRIGHGGSWLDTDRSHKIWIFIDFGDVIVTHRHACLHEIYSLRSQCGELETIIMIWTVFVCKSHMGITHGAKEVISEEVDEKLHHT